MIGETLKFALPINVAKSLIPDLKNGRNVVIPKTPVITQEPAPTPPPQQPYVPPQTYVPPPPVAIPEVPQPRFIGDVQFVSQDTVSVKFENAHFAGLSCTYSDGSFMGWVGKAIDSGSSIKASVIPGGTCTFHLNMNPAPASGSGTYPYYDGTKYIWVANASTVLIDAKDSNGNPITKTFSFPTPNVPQQTPTPVTSATPTFTSSVCSNPSDTNLRTIMETNDLSAVKSIINLCSGKLDKLANLLPLAVYYNQTNIAVYLLDDNFDPNYSGYVNGSLLPGTVNGLTALQIASQKRNLPLVQTLLNKGADVNTRGYGGFTALHFSVGYPDYIPELPRLLIGKGADVNVADNDGRTALTGAAGDSRSSDAVQLLLENGADVNAKTNNGTTALLQAIWNGAIENVKLLISKGADVSAKNDNGDTPLSLADQRGYPDIATLLKQAGAVK